MSWKKIMNSTRAGLSAFGVVLALVLSGVLSLLPSAPVSAYTFSSATKRTVTGVVFTANHLVANTAVTTGGGYQFDTRSTGTQSWDNPSLFFQVNFSTTIPANSLVSISLSVSHANQYDAPVCFTGDYGQQVIDCDISGDNTNNTITGIFFITSATNNLKLWSYAPVPNITLGTPAFAIGSATSATVNAEGISDSELQGLLTQIDYVVQNTDVTRNGIRSQLNNIDSDLDGLSTQLGYIVDNTDVTRNGIRSQLNDIISALDDVSTASDRQWQQEQSDRQDAQDAVDDSQDAADDASDDIGDATQSLLSAMSTTFALIRDTPASDCMMSITAGASGALQITDVDFCSVPNDMRQLINRVFGLVMIVASLLLSLNIFRSGMDLFAQATGYAYKEPEVTR